MIETKIDLIGIVDTLIEGHNMAEGNQEQQDITYHALNNVLSHVEDETLANGLLLRYDNGTRYTT